MLVCSGQGTKVNPWPFKTKEKKSKESESKQYFSNKDKVFHINEVYMSL